MNIYALFITRPDEESPELLVAWDEYTVDAAPEEWDEARANALEAVGNDVQSQALVTIKVSETEILKLLHPSGVVEGRVS
jgi:hypothetical protein